MINSKTIVLVFVFIGGSYLKISAQQTRLKGQVIAADTKEVLSEVRVSIEEHSVSEKTNTAGFFVFKDELPLGEQVLKLQKQGYKDQRYPIVINEGELLQLGKLEMQLDFKEQNRNITKIELSTEELDNERSSVANVSGLLAASKDIFFKAAAYDFSATFFKPRGLGNKNARVLINGIQLNNATTGRPEWAEFGGLNDVKRNQVFYSGLTANPYQFGGIGGTTNSIMRASQYRKGGKISYALANRSYRGRFMASYSTGLMTGGWAVTFLISGRFGAHGYYSGTSYNAKSIFGAIEKKFNDHHSLNFTAFYAPNRRGKTTILTEEVRKLKGMHYNPLWGKQAGEVRNSRMKTVKRPVFMLNHYWDFSEHSQLNTNVAYQFGEKGNTRIDNGGTRKVKGPDGQKAYIGGARNPSPDYYRNLPSYFLRDQNLGGSDFQAAYLAEHDFIEKGQLDWESLYQANAIARKNEGNSIYISQQDREDDNRFTVNTILETQLSEHLTLNASLDYSHLHGEYFAKVDDLLGGSGFLDINFYADEPNEITGLVTDLAQSDLNHPDRIVKEGDRYKYNYSINADFSTAFAQLQLKYKNIEAFVGTSLSQTTYQRDGDYKNGYYPDHSFGKSKPLHFTNFGVKGGFLYKITGRHLIRFDGGYLTHPPVIRNSFSNPRQNNFPVIGLKSEKIKTGNLSYVFRSTAVKGRLTGYYSTIKEATHIGFYFTQGLAGLGKKNNAAFVQEVTTGIDQRNIGVEFGVEAELVSGLTLKASGSFGQSVYTNNPKLYLTSEDFSAMKFHGKQQLYAEKHPGTPLRFGEGRASMKNYHLAGGPEQAYQFGAEYRGSGYWMLGITTNFFSHAYVDISRIRRTANFTTAADGFPIQDYDENRAHRLLQQDKLGSYILINMIGGKSWKIGDYYFGFFAVLSNVLNQEYRSGGFESSRKANYTQYDQDQSSRHGPQFGNRYFYGYGTTFYLNFYLRF